MSEYRKRTVLMVYVEHSTSQKTQQKQQQQQQQNLQTMIVMSDRKD
jgi:hypothetical protein